MMEEMFFGFSGTLYIIIAFRWKVNCGVLNRLLHDGKMAYWNQDCELLNALWVLRDNTQFIPIILLKLSESVKSSETTTTDLCPIKAFFSRLARYSRKYSTDTMLGKVFPRINEKTLNERVQSRDAFIYLDRVMWSMGWTEPKINT